MLSKNLVCRAAQSPALCKSQAKRNWVKKLQYACPFYLHSAPGKPRDRFDLAERALWFGVLEQNYRELVAGDLDTIEFFMNENNPVYDVLGLNPRYVIEVTRDALQELAQ